MQNEFFAFKFDGMTCIGAALETANDVVIWSEGVNYFAFALITPL